MSIPGIVWVALGSALGGSLRYALSSLLNGPVGFPWGTWGVNILGSFAIGLISGGLARVSGDLAAIVRSFAVIGLCGGFTTFSTFSNETLRMLENGQWWFGVFYVIGTVSFGLLAVCLGYALTR